MEVILHEKETRPTDLAELASYLDPELIVAVFRARKWNALARLNRLIDFAEDGTPSEAMRAIKMIDETWETALVRRGMLMGKSTAQLTGLPTNPIGMAQPIRSFEATQTTTRVRATMDAVAGQITDVAPQPLQEIEDHGKTQGNEEDDSYFNDDRGADANIFRPATTDHGQRTEI